MKKYMSTFVMLAMLAVSVPMLAGSASAQRRTYYNDGRYNQTYNRGYYNYDQGYYNENYDQPNVYDKHRKAINLAAGTGIGAIIGGLIGGKKGALIGGAAGLAGGAIVTAKQKPRNTTRYDFYRRN
jgi:hypothetical protein